MSTSRPSVFGKAMALDGDKTTTGAICIATIQTASANNKRMLRVGDPTTRCPKCGETGKVVTGETLFDNHGKAQAVHGSIVQCGCPFGANIVLALDSSSPSPSSTNRTSSLTTTSLVSALATGQFTHQFFIKSPANPLNAENIAYGIKTPLGLIEGVSKDDGMTTTVETPEEASVEVIYLFQTRIAMKK